jgi:hypothetical protein
MMGKTLKTLARSKRLTKAGGLRDKGKLTQVGSAVMSSILACGVLLFGDADISRD